MLALEREAAATIANAGPSTALRFAQDDNSEKGAEENRQLQGRNAGPSTAVLTMTIQGEMRKED
jgi:hypothetical protein